MYPDKYSKPYNKPVTDFILGNFWGYLNNYSARLCLMALFVCIICSWKLTNLIKWTPFINLVAISSFKPWTFLSLAPLYIFFFFQKKLNLKNMASLKMDVFPMIHSSTTFSLFIFQYPHKCKKIKSSKFKIKSSNKIWKMSHK